MMINPGSRPVENATEHQAAANLETFIDEATERGLRLTDEPERRPEDDADGRYAWTLPLEGGGQARILMPGADLRQVRDDLTSQAYCVRVGDNWWWWRDAVGMAVSLEPAQSKS